jgi:hypothetical protein
MATPMKTITFKLAGSDEIFQAEEWRLESAIEEAKWQLGLPIWVEYYEISQNDTPPTIDPELATYISNVCNSTKPKPVPPAPKKRTPRPKTSDVSPMLVVLDNTPPVDMVQEVLRDRTNRPTHPLSDGLFE